MLMNVLTSTLQCEFESMNGLKEKSDFVTILESNSSSVLCYDYEAHVTTDCAYLKYVPHVGVCLHVLCMTRVHGGANVNVAGAVLLETCACSVRTGDVSSLGSRAVMGTSRNLTVWFG